MMIGLWAGCPKFFGRMLPLTAERIFAGYEVHRRTGADFVPWY
jgi:hypothetical protein